MRTYTNFLSSNLRADLKALPWLCVALACILLPNILPVVWPVLEPGMASVVLHLAGLLLLPCLFGVRVRKVLLAYWPFVCGAPIAAAFYICTLHKPSKWFFLVVAETNIKEATVFMPQLVGVALLLIAMVAVYAWLMSRSVFKDLRLGPVSGSIVVICALLIPLAKLIRAGSSQTWKEEVWRVAENYPVGTITAGIEAAQMSYQVAHRDNVGKHLAVMSVGAPLPKGKREIHVLVLGESARFSSFQINGYERETTPLLAAQPGLLNFRDVVAPGPTTIMSVPVLLTPSNASNIANASTLPSLLNVFKTAGYRTYWLSTQMKHGEWDTQCSVFAQDADEAKFLSGKFPTYGDWRNAALDSALVDAAKDVLARGEKKVLLILHTMGSHANYSDRYPAEFNHFPSDPARIRAAYTAMTPEGNEQLHNSYDNTILFTDYVLSHLIHLLDEQVAVSSLYYVSDHGENGDSAVMPFAHGVLTQDVLRVPMMIWLSADYQAARPRQATALRSHLEAPFSSDTTFHTMQDLASLSCPLFKPQLSVASDAFLPGPRLVIDLEGSLLDYDQKIAPMATSTTPVHADR